MHVIIHDAYADNLPISYLDIGLPCKGKEKKKNQASHFFASFIVTMGCHLWGYKFPCLWAHTIILRISAHGMIVTKSAWREMNCMLYLLMHWKNMATVIPQCTGLYFHQNRTCDYYDYARSPDCHLWYVNSYSWWDAFDMKGDECYEQESPWA